jgi:prepilin-type N-terminal cleavage/methylation domain-containing protein
MTSDRVRERGFTLIEVLIALSVIAIAFAALGFVQVTNLRASSTARIATETKNAANQVLERQLALVLRTNMNACTDPTDTSWCDSGGIHYAFNDFFWTCPTPVAPDTSVALAVRPGSNVACTGSQTTVTPSGHSVTVDFGIAGESGIAGEGVLAISVTATHEARGGVPITIGDRVTCYDVYPTPTAGAPAPCPKPTAGGSGRP